MSDAQNYEIVFSGEILDGFDPEQVRQKIAAVFNLSAEKLEALFTHPHVILKRNLDADQAHRYSAALEKAGLKTSLRRSALPAEAVPEGRSEVGSAPRAEQAAAAAPPVMRERDVADLEVSSEPFEFNGSGREFFRIWIVNVFLSIVTLGIYSAWAKVRTQRYFYGNTRLQGSSFEYLADPLKILKGRLIGLALFGGISIAGELSPIFAGLGSLVLMILTPWIVVQSLRFRARNSAWRNVTFGFNGTVRGAVTDFVLWPLAGMLTFGILAPYAFYKQQKFIVDNHRFGASPFRFEAEAKAYYILMLSTAGVAIAGVLLAALAGSAVPPLGAILMVPVYLFVFAWFTAKSVNLKYNNTALDDHGFSATYQVGSYARLVLLNTLGMVLTAGLFYPWAKVRTAQYAAQHMELIVAGDLEGFLARQQEEMSAIGQEVGDIFDVEFGL